MARSALLNVMVQAVLKAGRGLARDFGEVENLQVSLKGPGDFVSSADKRSEETIVEALQKARPGYGFLTEESGTIAGSDTTHRWLVDPLDGTTNFLHGIPIFSISIALERDGELVAGVVYNPVMNELYVGEKGQGAFLNDRRLRVAARQRLADTVIATGTPHIGRDGQDEFVASLRPLLSTTAGIRRAGSAALDLAWVASGRYDGFWERGINAWDMGAGIVLVREAGGIVTGTTGKADMLQSGTILAGNEAIHKALLASLSASARA